MAGTMNYELENPGNIRERLMLYSDFVKKQEEKKKASENEKNKSEKEEE
ncbi:MAG: hypothetical protein ACI4C0_04965 [Lachnospiraceae bacterium]